MIDKVDAKDLKMMPQIQLWEENLDRYGNDNDLDFKKNAIYLTEHDKTLPTPDDTGLMVVRIAFSDLDGKISTERKYVILQTFYDEGNLSTVDVVRLPLGYHREIVKEYLNKILSSEISRQVIPLDDDGHSRFLTAGGFLKAGNGKIRFEGSSVDFSNNFSTYDVNDVASYLVDESGLFDDVESKNLNEGKEYVERCLDIMRTNKFKPEFYSELVDFYHLENVRESKHTGSHILYSLNMMKSIDRAVKEGIDPIQAIVEETVEGMGREIMLRGVAEKIKQERKK
jgi:hypothetical protein